MLATIILVVPRKETQIEKKFHQISLISLEFQYRLF